MVPCGVQPLRSGVSVRADQEIQHRGEDHDAYRNGQGGSGLVCGEQGRRFVRQLRKALSCGGHHNGQEGSEGQEFIEDSDGGRKQMYRMRGL